MLIAQISDCHIVEPGALFADRIDSAAGLTAAVTTIGRLDRVGRRPDLIVASGDLVNDATAPQYEHLMDLLADVDIPLLPAMGNHDDRTELRRRFPDVVPPGVPETPIAFTVDDHPLRLVILDTTLPGRHDGGLGPEQLAWLDDELAAAPDTPTVVVQHHPPFTSGIPFMDDDAGFADTAAETTVLARHRHVEAVICGHLHRAMHRRVAGTIAMTCPSTAASLVVGLGSSTVGYSTEPTGILLHDWRPGVGLTSHVVTIGVHEHWTPDWSM